MDELSLLIDLHKDSKRQGPGGEAETLRALDLSNTDRSKSLKVADIGCGTGASTLVLARELDATITAVDFLDEFLKILIERAEDAVLAEKINPISCSMENLPFSDEEFDIIWAESSVYNMGFENGLQSWRRFLKPEGILAVSEITWLTESRPPELWKHWHDEYPEIDLASSKIATLEKCGYSPAGYFILPEHCWTENYYNPLQERFEAFLKQYDYCEEAQAIVDAELREMDIYEMYSKYVGYGFYVAKKLD